jgi:hypothetical protein
LKLVPARPSLGSGIIFGMENETRRLSDLARILLVVAVLVTAVTTHYLDTAGVFRVQDLTATEMSETLRWLDQFYSAPEGLQRPNGIIVDGHVDFESIASWLFGNYLAARSHGNTPEQAREIVGKQIRESDEWRQKHP